MNTKIYVGNLSFETEDTELEELFQNYGEVTEVNVIKDRNTGRARGFGFVEMKSHDEANQAISSLNSSDFMGRPIIVNMAKAREDKSIR